MFIKAADKKDKTTGKVYRYYKLCESYRIGNKTRHKTIHTLGKIDEIGTNEEKKILADRIEQLLKGGQTLFCLDIPEYIEKLARHYYALIKRKRTISPILQPESIKSKALDKDYQLVDVSSLSMEDVREIGCEWLCKQVLEELDVETFLKSQNWTKKQIDTALLHLISKATYPASEHKTAQWINENSSVSELFGQEPLSINRFHLYKASKMLYKVKDGLEDYLSVKTNELFDLEDKIILNDLTNIYFEGRKVGSQLAKFHRSKEKRNDAKLVALALVVNVEGFVKYSKIYRGNIADCKTLENIVSQLALRTSFTGRKPTVVIDAGIATDENLKMLNQKEYSYVCVTRSKLKDYKFSGDKVVQLQDKRNHPIEVRWVEKQGQTDRYLYVHSQLKAIKESSMDEHFSERYEEELENLAQSIHKKRGTKKYDKVMERIGRIKERYSTANKHYEITVKAENNIAILITWKRKPAPIRAQEGVYFLRTNLEQTDEKQMWDIYNTIREIEATFRILKSDLSLRPIYHQKDDSTEAHLFLSILAYVIVSTIRYKLKKQGINHDWQNIVRIMNTQKAGTISMNLKDNKQINKRICSIPSASAQEIYSATNYKHMPFYRKNIVLPE
jgi:transposase